MNKPQEQKLLDQLQYILACGKDNIIKDTAETIEKNYNSVKAFNSMIQQLQQAKARKRENGK